MEALADVIVLELLITGRPCSSRSSPVYPMDPLAVVTGGCEDAPMSDMNDMSDRKVADGADDSQKNRAALTVRSTSIGSDGRFAVECTGRGDDVSPGLQLDGLDPRARTLAVTLEDLTHPLFGTMAHWLAWNIPAGGLIPPAIPSGRTDPSTGVVQGLAYGLHRYRGPKPPRGRTHTYRFTVYALDCELTVSSLTRLAGLRRAIKGHVLQRATLEGVFE